MISWETTLTKLDKSKNKAPPNRWKYSDPQPTKKETLTCSILVRFLTAEDQLDNLKEAAKRIPQERVLQIIPEVLSLKPPSKSVSSSYSRTSHPVAQSTTSCLSIRCFSTISSLCQTSIKDKVLAHCI